MSGVMCAREYASGPPARVSMCIHVCEGEGGLLAALCCKPGFSGIGMHLDTLTDLDIDDLRHVEFEIQIELCRHAGASA